MEKIMEEVKKSIEGITEGMVMLQRRGNRLRRLSPEQTVAKLMECLINETEGKLMQGNDCKERGEL